MIDRADTVIQKHSVVTIGYHSSKLLEARTRLGKLRPTNSLSFLSYQCIEQVKTSRKQFDWQLTQLVNILSRC